MHKLKLELEALVVESFVPAVVESRPGTVHAHRSGPVTDECDSCGADSACGGCDTLNGCGGGSYTCSCPGWQTCVGAYTCGGVDSCVWPECTAYGAIC